MDLVQMYLMLFIIISIAFLYIFLNTNSWELVHFFIFDPKRVFGKY